MIIRILLNSALIYGNQMERIRKKHLVHNEVPTDSFVSHLKKTDKIVPVIGLVLNLSNSPWDKQTKFSDILKQYDCSEWVVGNHFEIKVIDPYTIPEEDFELFKTEVGTVLRLVKHQNDEYLDKYIQNLSQLTSVDEETYVFIKNLLQFKISKVTNKEGGINMCKGMDLAIKRHEKEARKKADEELKVIKAENKTIKDENQTIKIETENRIKEMEKNLFVQRINGFICGLTGMEVPEATIIQQLIKQFQLSTKQANNYYNAYTSLNMPL